MKGLSAASLLEERAGSSTGTTGVSGTWVGVTGCGVIFIGWERVAGQVLKINAKLYFKHNYLFLVLKAFQDLISCSY